MEVASAEDLEIDELIDDSDINDEDLEEEYDEEKLGIKEDDGSSERTDAADSISDLLEKMSREREVMKSKTQELHEETTRLKEATKRRHKLGEAASVRSQSRADSQRDEMARTPSERVAMSASPATKEKMRRPDDRARAESRKRSSRAATNQQFADRSPQQDLDEPGTVSPQVISIEDNTDTKTVMMTGRDIVGI